MKSKKTKAELQVELAVLREHVRILQETILAMATRPAPIVIPYVAPHPSPVTIWNRIVGTYTGISDMRPQ